MGNVNIVICQGSSCFSRGNKENLMVIQQYLKKHELEAQVSFKGQLCADSCNQSPIIIVNDKTYTEVDEESTLNILNTHFNKA